MQNNVKNALINNVSKFAELYPDILNFDFELEKQKIKRSNEHLKEYRREYSKKYRLENKKHINMLQRKYRLQKKRELIKQKEKEQRAIESAKKCKIRNRAYNLLYYYAVKAPARELGISCSQYKYLNLFSNDGVYKAVIYYLDNKVNYTAWLKATMIEIILNDIIDLNNFNKENFLIVLNGLFSSYINGVIDSFCINVESVIKNENYEIVKNRVLTHYKILL